MNISLWILWKPEKYPFSFPVARRAPQSVAASKLASHDKLQWSHTYKIHICVWNDMHNKTFFYVQHICKKCDFHSEWKLKTNTITRHVALVLIACNTHHDVHISQIKSVKMKTLQFMLHIFKKVRFHNKNETCRHTTRWMTSDNNYCAQRYSSYYHTSTQIWCSRLLIVSGPT
jgi:hypothetical protein